MVPFLKWPGGKRWFIVHNANLMPKSFDRYVEPFLGGGSVFFHLEPKNALLADTNGELIATYEAIRDQPANVWRALRRYHRLHDEKLYYRVRDRIPSLEVSRAARMVYLNRTCFNGIYRVNREGKFNVPIGTKTSVILDSDDFVKASKLLSTADIRVSDFEPIIDEAKSGDFMFIDPPYTVSHSNNGFVKYNENLFSWDDQKRLVAALSRARDRGAMVLGTNADHSSLRQMYRAAGFSLRSVERFSSISSSSDGRTRFKEIIIQCNFPRVRQ